MTGEPHFPARFDAEAFREDASRATPTARVVAETARRDFEASGIPRSLLRPCDGEGRDGTELPQCLKVYLPQPAGPFGMVFKFVMSVGSPRLDFLAFGVRHHPRESNAPSVYEIADRRVKH